jgi:hypothetical protein
MATDESIDVHPGDIIQGTQPGPTHGHLFLVTETHSRHVGAVSRWFDDGTDHETYSRFKPGTFAVVGAAAILPPEVAADRRDSLATAKLVAREARPVDPDDLTPQWDVEVRFSGRVTGSGQVYRERLQADCVEEALDKVKPPVMAHGGSICIVGVTVDEVKS